MTGLLPGLARAMFHLLAEVGEGSPGIGDRV